MRIGVGAGWTAPRPGVPCLLDFPVFTNCPVPSIGIDRAAIGMPSRSLAMLNGLPPSRRGPQSLRGDRFAVTGMDNEILVAVEDNSWNHPSAPDFNRRPNAHGIESRRQIAGRSGGQTRMDSGRCVKIGISLSHNRRRCPARRKPCN